VNGTAIELQKTVKPSVDGADAALVGESPFNLLSLATVESSVIDSPLYRLVVCLPSEGDKVMVIKGK
jgi:hypothetical protein